MRPERKKKRQRETLRENKEAVGSTHCRVTFRSGCEAILPGERAQRSHPAGLWPPHTAASLAAGRDREGQSEAHAQVPSLLGLGQAPSALTRATLEEQPALLLYLRQVVTTHIVSFLTSGGTRCDCRRGTERRVQFMLCTSTLRS